MNALRAEELYAEALGRQVRLTRSFFEASSQELVEQQVRRRKQPAGRNLAREGSENPYEEFLECLLLYYLLGGREGGREGYLRTPKRRYYGSTSENRTPETV